VHCSCSSSHLRKIHSNRNGKSRNYDCYYYKSVSRAVSRVKSVCVRTLLLLLCYFTYDIMTTHTHETYVIIILCVSAAGETRTVRRGGCSDCRGDSAAGVDGGRPSGGRTRSVLIPCRRVRSRSVRRTPHILRCCAAADEDVILLLLLYYYHHRRLSYTP